jgi:ketosteroid isomerase-like protein
MRNMPKSPQTTARAFVKAINDRDIDKLWKLLSDEHRFVDSLGTVIHGREKMRDGWAAYFRMVPDYAVIVDETFSEGAIIVMLGAAQGTYVKDGQLLKENFWQTPAAWRAQIRDEKVVEWRVYADNEPIRQLMAKNK